MTRTDHGPTARFCEPWPVQAVHTSPVFQALNNTVLDSLFFFPLIQLRRRFGFGIGSLSQTKHKPLPHSLNHALSLSASLSLSLHLSSLPLSFAAVSHHILSLERSSPQPISSSSHSHYISASLPRHRRPL